MCQMLYKQYEGKIQPKQVYNLNRKQTGIKQNLGEVKDSHLWVIFYLVVSEAPHLVIITVMINFIIVYPTKVMGSVLRILS